MIEYLDHDDLFAIAQIVVGSAVQVGDWGLLASAAARPAASIMGEDAYPSVYLKAAALIHSLATNHALVDGNKRLAWAGAAAFFELNRLDLRAPTVDQAERFMLSLADGSLRDLQKISAVLHEWCEPL